MIIYLIRHGETEYTKLGRIQGRLPIPLSDEGHTQAKEIAIKLKTLNATHLYSSPLTRAKETALPIAELTKLPIIFDELLVERHYGTWQNKQWDTIFENNPNIKDEWKQKGIDFAPPEGESIKEMINRTKKFIKKISNKHKDNDKILVITHGGMIKMFLGNSKEIPKNTYYNQKIIKTGSIIELKMNI